MQNVQTMLNRMCGLMDTKEYRSTYGEQRELLRRLKKAEQALTTVEAMLSKELCELCGIPLKYICCFGDTNTYAPCKCKIKAADQRRIEELEGKLSDEQAKLRGSRIGRERDVVAHALNIRYLEDEHDAAIKQLGHNPDKATLLTRIDVKCAIIAGLQGNLMDERAARQQDKDLYMAINDRLTKDLDSMHDGIHKANDRAEKIHDHLNMDGLI